MFDALKTIGDPSKATDEQISKAYELVKEYCDNNNTDVLTFVNNDANIKPAAKEIHSGLPWLFRKAVSADKIEELITTNIDFIREKAKEHADLEKKAAAAAAKALKATKKQK